MVSAKVLHSLFNKMWNEEDLPQDWILDLLVKLPKKVDLCLCKNGRGIMLLTVASKVLCKIILERMKDALEGRLRDEQAGFRKERSYCHQMATRRIIVEQTLEWNTGLYMVFSGLWKGLWFHRSRSALEDLAALQDPWENREDDPGLLRWLTSKSFVWRWNESPSAWVLCSPGVLA